MIDHSLINNILLKDMMRLCVLLQILLSVSWLYSNENNEKILNYYTENDAVKMALNCNQKIQSLKTNVQIANYQFKYGSWVKNPELRISDISTRYLVKNIEEYNIGLRWRFGKFGETSKLKQEANVDYWDAKIKEINYKQNLIAKVRQSFADVIMYEQLTKLAERKVAVEAKRLDIVEHMVDLGGRSVVYYTKAKMWHAESNNTLARMNQRKRLARLQLSKLTGLSENDSLIFNSVPEINQPFESIIELAFKNRPEITLIQQKIALASKRYRYEHLQLFPWFSFIEGSYHKEKNRSNDWTEIKLGMTIPIINPNAANIRSTKLAVEKRENELDAVREQIEDEVRDAYTTYMDLMLDWKNFSIMATELIVEADAITSQANIHQTLMPDEVLELKLTIIETESLLEDKRNQLMHALIDLEKIVGVENLSEYIPGEND